MSNTSQTDRKIKANKPDITIKYKREKTCKLMVVKIPEDKNTSVAEFEKVSKYKDLEIEAYENYGNPCCDWGLKYD